MKILATNVYVGPNIYAGFPVIRHVIDVGVLEQWPSVRLGQNFIEKLLAAIPSLHEHHCSHGEEGGFVRRLKEDEGTWIGHIWEHVTLEIQMLAGVPVSFGRTRGNGKEGQYNLVFEYKQRDVGLRASELARDLLVSIMPDEVKAQVEHKVPEDFDFAYEKVRFIRFAQKMNFGPSTQSIVDAAIERNIPYLRLNEASLIQLGYGKYQKRIQATITSETRFISVELASNKSATANLLDSLGLPVPQQRIIGSEREAAKAFHSIGGPVVVKPLDGNHGRGISINLTTEEAVVEAFHVAKEVSRSVIVESFLEGEDHRMLVVNGKLIAVAKRVPGHVVGDGKKTVAELVEIVNQDPRRGVGHEKVLTRLELDYAANQILEKKGYTAETILKDGEVCYLRDTANLSTGGTAIDLTDQVHPDNKEMAERAIKAIGLDVGGVDFLIKDISQSYHDIGGGICEVNAAPGFRMHTHPTEGKSRDVAGAVIDMLFPEPEKARIPTVAITGTNGKTTTSRMVAHLWKQAGKVVGLTTTDGIYINGKLTVKGDTTGPVSAHMVLQDPNTEIAVLETARGGLLRSGLGYEFCNVGACLNVTADHIDISEGNGLADLAKVKRIITDAARDTAVLNADDIECLKMASTTEAENIFYVTMNPQHNLVREHIRLGGKAVIIEKGVNGDMITIFDNGVHVPVLWTHLIPATMEGKAIHNVQNAMFAVAIAYSMGMNLDDLRNGLRTFVNSYHQTPGRMNFYDEHPFKVLLDYGHNPAAINMIGKFVDQMSVSGKKLAVVTFPGDRTNALIEESVKLLPSHFTHFICKQDDNRRGRKDGEVPELIRELLIKHGANPANVEVVLDEQDAINKALSTAHEGDFIVVLADKVSRCWKQITSYKSDGNTRVKEVDTRAEDHLLDRVEVDLISDAINNATIRTDKRGVIIEVEEENND
ncbi:MAG: cyanophycin synthetase [Neisseriales bacterium]|nr:MAG: cyanophycin synthetase [Neisseriales bacterium]